MADFYMADFLGIEGGTSAPMRGSDRGAEDGFDGSGWRASK